MGLGLRLGLGLELGLGVEVGVGGRAALRLYPNGDPNPNPPELYSPSPTRNLDPNTNTEDDRNPRDTRDSSRDERSAAALTPEPHPTP